MPFDDSDIKKMIEAQITKGGLRLGSEGSSEVQDLILRMLQPEVTQRWPIELVQKHSWFGRQMNAENQTSSISYVTTTTTNRAQEQSGVHQVQKRQGPPVYA
jgi:serine/threonine protein kinase